MDKRVEHIFLFFLISFLLIGCKKEIEEPCTYVVSVGISKYKSINNLRLAERDAESVAQLFDKRSAKTILLRGAESSKTNILQTLKNHFIVAKPQDLVVLFFSGHGYQGGFCPYDMTQNAESGLSYEDIRSIFKDCKAKNKIIIADACYSGLFRGETGENHSASLRAQSEDSSSNVVVFLSSRSNETSIESPFMAYGLFTNSLIRGLRGGADSNRDRIISAKEIFDFVSISVKEKSQDKQHPVMWGKFNDDMILMDWR